MSTAVDPQICPHDRWFDFRDPVQLRPGLGMPPAADAARAFTTGRQCRACFSVNRDDGARWIAPLRLVDLWLSYLDEFAPRQADAARLLDIKDGFYFGAIGTLRAAHRLCAVDGITASEIDIVLARFALEAALHLAERDRAVAPMADLPHQRRPS